MPLERGQLRRRVLVQELVDRQVSTADLDHDLATLDPYVDPARAKLIDAFRLAHEQDLELFLVRVVVDVVAERYVGDIRLDRYVELHLVGNIVEDVGELLDVQAELVVFPTEAGVIVPELLVELAHLIEQLEARLVGHVQFLLNLQHVVGRDLHLPLVLGQPFHAGPVLAFEFRNFLHKHIIVRLLIIAHLLKFSNVITLVSTDLF